jgi:hypothetical protein
MEAPIIFNTVLTDLMNDRIQLEQELERCFNLDINVSDKVEKIKVALGNIAHNDSMVSKLHSYMPITNDEKTKKNGKV